MLLLDPDIGEILDRLSILQLKLDVGMRHSVPTARWEEEQRQLDSYLQKKILNWQRAVTAHSMANFEMLNAQLALTNARLWQAEDEIRKFTRMRMPSDLTDDELREVARIALSIVHLNDARSEAMRSINKIFGIDAQEKIYV